MENKENVNKNAIYNMIKNIFSILFPLITFPYISRVLGADHLGQINFSSSFVGYFGLAASLGVSTYAIRECGKVREDKEKLGKMASQIFSINLASMVVAYTVLAITLIFARPLDSYRTLILIQSLNILFTTIGTDWLNSAMGDFQFIALRTVIMQVISLVSMLLFVRDSDDFVVYAWVNVAAQSGANLINIFYRKKYCKVKFTFQINLKKHLPPILLLFSMLLSQTIFVNTDVTILGLVRGDFEVGLYSTSTKIYSFTNTVVASIAWVVMPQLSGLFEKKEYEKINPLLKYALNFIVVLGLPCLVGMNVIAGELIETIAGKEYLGAAVSLRILSAALFCSFVSGFFGNIILLPSGREKIVLLGSAVSAVINFVLNIFFIPRFGLNAAAVTTAVSNFFMAVVLFPFIEKEVKIDGLRKIFRAPVCGGISLFVFMLIIKHLTRNSFLVTACSVIGGSILYLGILLIMKDEFLLGYFRPLYKKFKGRKHNKIQKK